MYSLSAWVRYHLFRPSEAELLYVRQNIKGSFYAIFGLIVWDFSKLLFTKIVYTFCMILKCMLFFNMHKLIKPLEAKHIYSHEPLTKI